MDATDIVSSTPGVTVTNGTGAAIGTSAADVIITIDTATDLTPGLLSAADHATFAGKQDEITPATLSGTANRTSVSGGTGALLSAATVDIDTTLLPSPGAGDVGKALLSTGANAAAWQTISIADEKSKVSSDDTTAGYLDGKLVAGTGISLTVGSPAGDETLSISVGSNLTQAATSTLNGYLTAADWSTFNSKLSTLSESDVPNLSASKITSGTFDIARIPIAALERLVIVADQTARYALTTTTAQNGDTVKQTDNDSMWYIVDDTKLNEAAGYSAYTAGTASAVAWSGITDKPAWTAQAADLTHDGYLTDEPQAIGGAKTFTPNITVNNSVAGTTVGSASQINTVNPGTKGLIIRGAFDLSALSPDTKFYADYASDADARYAAGSPTATLFGGATVSDGKLHCTGTPSAAYYSGINNADFAQVGTIRMLITPNYSGTPSSLQCLWIVRKNIALGETPSELALLHQNGTGYLYLYAQDSGGVARLTSVDMPTVWNPVSGTEYEIEVNYDFTAGATRIFIDGVQHIPTLTTTFTRSAGDLLYLVLGSYSGGNNFPANCSYDDVALFNTVQHTAAFPSELPHLYGEQTALLLDLQDSVGNSVMTVNPNGVISVGGFTFAELTGDTVPYITLDKQVASSTVTSTEINYVHGVTSAIQTQINGKEPTLTKGNLTGTANRTGVTGGTGAVIGSGAVINIDTSLLPSPVIGDVGKALLATGADTAAWTTISVATYGAETTWAAADGVTKVITHNYGTRAVIVQIYDLTTYDTIYVDSVVRTDTNTVTLTSSSAPPAGGWSVCILRIG